MNEIPELGVACKNFIELFRKLYAASPQCGSWTRASENCDYGDITTVSKDCYMCFNSGNCRDAYHCHDCREMTDSTDCSFCEACTLAYECTDCNNCYDSNFCQDCTNCEGVNFSYDLRRCKNCFGCVTLRDKEYCIFNQQYSKEDYEKYLQDFDYTDNAKIKLTEKKLQELKKKMPRMYVHTHDTTNCTGDYIYHSKNCHHCFDTRHTEDSMYIYQANLDMGTRDSLDCGPIPTGMDLCYDASYSHYLFNCEHIYWCGNLKDCSYCMNCFESANLCGCHYLKNKQDGFYILNQKVDEKYFHKIVEEIKILLKEKGIYTLHDLLFKDEKLVAISEDQLKRKCAICGAGFEIVEKEREFYEGRKILFPIYCPNCRAIQRFNLRNERVMYKRTCDNCKKTLISTYPADSKYIVYCLKCYWEKIG